ncbi:Topoisomerase 1-associated factor 1 [Talaromyces atroroseus]|uniref:Topoisomerase 1-associated factor 1 n=1 Tax=Talaromyces atroroseus TaxID=1441469 RepID=A0A225B3B3_TALAT|nr:Topoisomerase 1-associated factor 1 [Talaromyces atroroseus]OKL62489.1 Topoisomerase 1-associated factor 1 [Talaromyces atroroseus]
MDLDAVAVGQDVQVVDPEVRAHVYSLVTALGGFNGEDVSKYSIGDDALACLRDIKKWLRLYDEKTNRLDVARCLGEANLVNGDLLPILSLWFGNGGHTKKHMTRIALACLELLVPLTWPVEIHSQMTVNHHRHTPYLQQVQVQYKRGLLDQHAGMNVLRSIIGIGLPSLSLPKSERTNRDEGILKLVLYLFRNVAMISAPKGLVTDTDEEEISRSATINAFQQQQVFALLLTMCSNINDEFSFQDVVLLEILFHLVKGVNVQKLFMNDTERNAKRNDELGDLLQKESGVSREYAKTAPTRHGRFGTMIWVKRDDAKVSTVSGQDILKDGQTAFNKMDQSKKWNRPKHGRRQQEAEAASGDFSSTTHLTPAAYINLRTFVEEFLDTGFNPLLTHVRKAIEREANRVVDINTRQWLYLVAWFLQAERERRRYQQKQHEKTKGTSKEIEPDSFSLVAGVLNQETFVFLNRAMQYSYDNKEWQDLNANMRCFTQILLTVQEMAASPLEEDQEIAENIQNRIFYEETTHDRILSIVRGYNDQGFAYLDACTELAHVFLRMLENYSKENVDMQVRSKRRSKRAKKTNSEGQDEENVEENDSEAEELADAARAVRERKFDFKRFSARFCSQKSVDTYVLFTAYYRELDDEQLKRAHRFFYRVAFKQELSTLLFRVDILNLFYRMIKGPGSLDSTKPIYKDWQELVKQLTRKMIKKLDERPALFTEMLFSKVNSTLFFLEYGYEKQTLFTGGTRPPAELEVHPRAGTSTDTKLNVVVAALIMDGRADLAKWLSDCLGSAANERSSWEAEQTIRQEESPEAVVPPSPIIEIQSKDDSIRTAMFRNGRIRLLMKLVGLERLGTEDVMGASWFVPSSLDSAALSEVKSVIDKGLENPVTEVDGLDPREQLRRKPMAEPRETFQTTLDVDFGSESEGEDGIPDGPLFPPNIRSKSSNALEELKEKRRKRRQSNKEKEPLDDSTIEERRRNREENARARQAKIKSDLFVHDSDDESDEEADKEFFAREEVGRKAQDQRIREALVSKALEEDDASSSTEQPRSKKTNRRKRRSIDGDDHGEKNTSNKALKKPRVSIGGFELSENDDDDDDDDEDDDVLMTGLSDNHHGSSKGASTSREDGEHDTPPTSAEHEEWDLDKELNNHKDLEQDAAIGTTAHANDSEEDAPVASNRRRGRAGFVFDSDSE